MLKLTHHVNCKCNRPSHEIGAVNVTENGCYTFDFTDIVGVGSSKQEAMNDYKEKFSKRFRELTEFKKQLFADKNLATMEVGTSGIITGYDEDDIERKILNG